MRREGVPDGELRAVVDGGLHNMVATCGLGALKPNTIVLPLERAR